LRAKEIVHPDVIAPAIGEDLEAALNGSAKSPPI
jgi:hypothetical protein